MMWETDKPLRGYNTFGIAAKAAYFLPVVDLAGLEYAMREQPAPFFILGGGSNVLFTGDLPAAVLANRIQGIEVLHENEDEVKIAVGAGMRWHDLVTWSVERGYGGLENLSLIPGQVGAAPIQNIGAYGVEVSSAIEAVDAYDLDQGEVLRFPHQYANLVIGPVFLKRPTAISFLYFGYIFAYCADLFCIWIMARSVKN